MSRRPSDLEMAERLSRSLVPNLHAAPMWNAVAISFFAPQKTLGKALETANAIDELRKATTRRPRLPPTKKNKAKAKRHRRQRG